MIFRKRELCMTLIVETGNGKVKGFKENIGDKGVTKFLGIPYCQSPVGELRFAPPKPHPGWTGVFEALNYSKISIQPPPDPSLSILDDPYNIGEDCLTLNIYVPGEPFSKVDSLKKSVMVWIHGGGLLSGASSWQMYNPTNLALKGDVIVVTINYRLGALGFLAVGSEESTGNFGILDQLAALRWIKDNIATFGGNPENITIFGESAGSMSVSTLVALPKAKGLFNRAICESGAPVTMDFEKAMGLKEQFLATLSLKDDKDLLSVSAADILSVQNDISTQVGYDISLPFLPIVDGILIKEHPYETYKKGQENPVDLLIGTNRDEMNLFSLSIPDLAKLSFEMIPGLFAKKPELISGYSDVLPDSLIDRYRDLLDESVSPLKLWCTLATDVAFRIPSICIAKAHSSNHGVDDKVKTYCYRFEWVSSFLSGNLGSCHGLEIPFVFDLLDHPFIGMFAGADRPESKGLSEFMTSAWYNFAKTGIPDGHWDAYDESSQKIMIINADSKCAKDDLNEFTKLWE